MKVFVGLLFSLFLNANCFCQSNLASWGEHPKYYGVLIDKSKNTRKVKRKLLIPVAIQRRDSESCYFYFDPFLPSNVQLRQRGDTIVSELPKMNGYPNAYSNGILAVFGSIGDSWRLENMYFLRMESTVRLNNIFFDELIHDTVYCYSVNGPGNRSHSDYLADYAITRGGGIQAYRLDLYSDKYEQAYVSLKTLRKKRKGKELIAYWEEKFKQSQ
jgi:hypothetical protein